MALKPTIYKFKIMVSDLDREHYEALNLTVAQHPSETLERMLVRVLAYCLNVQERLVFTKGLSAVDEPDLLVKTLDDQLALWIDVGEPAVDRIKKATRLTSAVKVYSFNAKSSSWWTQNQALFEKLNVSIYQFQCPQIQALAKQVQRTMDFSLTITSGTMYISTATGESEVSWSELQ
ncbi:MAG: hypothetical protein ACI9NY_000626 [Kiritimatiellia bacterium]